MECKRIYHVPTEFLSFENQKGLKGKYFSNSELKGNPAFEKQDKHINFKWTLYSPNPEKLQPDNYSVLWTGKLSAPYSGTYQLGLRGNDGFRLFVNGKLVIDNWEKLSYSTKTVALNFEKGKYMILRLNFMRIEEKRTSN